ncbi:MAG TPA: alpha/beta hydrolase [Candidatus Binataceae bacterium]|jgi:monoterpene epsilon-lactone hydrolase|nr:alpha/beta hydrolase [Candidatus Binataceae bacterium]
MASNESQFPSVAVDPDGTVHLGPRVIPVPKTLNTEARQYLATPPWGDGAVPPSQPMWELRTQVDSMLKMLSGMARSAYPVQIDEQIIDGVRTDLVSPVTLGEGKQERVLINLHGGAFVLGSGSLVEAIPIANLTQTCVVSVDYRLAPEHPFPAAIDDIVTVYRELLKTYQPNNIGLFGSSAGAVLTGETAVRLRQLDLPLPAALGVFSGSGDMSDFGDSAAIYTLSGFWGELIRPLDDPGSEIKSYIGGHDSKDPVILPVYADLSGFPPTLLITSTRDALLSGTSSFHRALRRAGVEADLFVFEAMPHCHWYAIHLPEAKEALQIMADFFDTRLGR